MMRSPIEDGNTEEEEASIMTDLIIMTQSMQKGIKVATGEVEEALRPVLDLIFYHFTAPSALSNPTTFSRTCNCCVQSITFEKRFKAF